MWNDLTMKQRADVISMAVKAGMRDLDNIRSFYDKSIGSSREYKGGGYLDWKKIAGKYKNLDIDNDKTYDYEGWYNEDPQRAWDFLNDDPDAHFDDKYKTVYHPTFSTYSKYSGNIDSKFNPQGLVGGTWSKDNHTFTMSPDGYKGPVSMDERKAYLEDAENNGVQLREADGSLPIYDGIIWGGVLPTVTVKSRKFGDGGLTVNQDPIHVKNYPIVNAEDEGLSEYFMNNKNVAGMAIGKGLNGIHGRRKIVMNPYSDVLKTDLQKEGLIKIEAVRHAMDKNKYKAPFELSEHQKNLQKTTFKGTPYGSNDEAFKQSIISRILMNDTTGLHITPEQMAEAARFDFTKYKKKALGGPLYEHVYMGGGPMGYYNNLGNVQQLNI